MYYLGQLGLCSVPVLLLHADLSISQVGIHNGLPTEHRRLRHPGAPRRLGRRALRARHSARSKRSGAIQGRRVHCRARLGQRKERCLLERGRYQMVF